MYFNEKRIHAAGLFILLAASITCPSYGTENFMVPYPCPGLAPDIDNVVPFSGPKLRRDLTQEFVKKYKCQTISLEGKIVSASQIHESLVLWVDQRHNSHPIVVFLDVNKEELDNLVTSEGSLIELSLFALSIHPVLSIKGDCIEKQCKELGLNGKFEKQELQLYAELLAYELTEQ